MPAQVAIPEAPPNVAQLARHVALDFAGDEAPTRVRLFAAGTVATSKGDFVFSEKAAQACLAAAADYGNDYCFDYAHSMFGFMQPDPAEANKAAGWYKLAVENGELWATGIEWTPAAKAKILAKEYRYISPTFTHEDGEITELLNVALTNMPATKRMKPLKAARTTVEKKEDPMFSKAMLALLGVAESADEAAVMAVLQGWKASADKVVELAAKLGEYESAARVSKLESLIAKGQADGKISPAMVDWAKAQTFEQLEKFLSVVPVLVKAPVKEPKVDDKGEPSLTPDELRAAAQMGISPTALLERKKARAIAPKQKFEDD